MSSISPQRPILGRAVAVAVLSALGVFSAGTARAEDLPAALQGRLNNDSDRQAVDSLDFILSLGLTRQQARLILPLYEEACELHIRAYHDQAETQPEQVEALRAFLAEDRLNQGFTLEVEKRTARIRHRAVEAREKLTLELSDLAEKVGRRLTWYQRHLAEEYRPNREAVSAALAGRSERQRLLRRARYKPPRCQEDDPLLVRAVEEREKLRQAVYPRLGAMAKYLLHPAAGQSLYELAGARMPAPVRAAVKCWREGLQGYSREQREKDGETIRKLCKELNHWNLVNGMHFSREQIEKLVYLAEEAERLRAAQRKAKPRRKLPGSVFNQELVRLELAAEAVLRPGQLEVLGTYSPCVIPPKNLKDPVRVGQAADRTHLVRWLSRAREGTDRQVERMIERLLESETEHLGPLDEEALERRGELLRETVRQAAGMTEVEFAVNQEELAEAIKPVNRKKELTAKIDRMRRERVLPGRTCEFLLNDGFARVLTERYQQLARGARSKKADLAEGPKAPDCEKGCAIRREKSK